MVKFPRWGWAVFSGILTLVLGIMLLAQMPISGVWFIGFAIGVKLIFDRVKQLREEYEQSQTKLKHLLARQLREAAAKLDK